MADPSPETIEERQARADKLQTAANEAAGHVRNLYIAFLSFGLYLAITVGGTTDEQLLRESPVRLPIVGVDLPLFAFYWIAPFLFVLFHFNLLLQLHLLGDKLRLLDDALRGLPDETDRRATLSQFVFSQMLIGDHHDDNGRAVIHWLLKLMGWITFVVLPIAVLLLTQIQFLPYHDDLTTWWQRLLVGTDLLLLWILWLPAIDPGGLSRQVTVVMRRRARRFLRWLAEPLDWPAWPIIGVLALIRAVSTLPMRIRRRIRDDLKRNWRILRLQELSTAALLMALLIATIPGEFLSGPIDRLTDDRGNLGPINRNLSLSEAELNGLHFRGRDLQFADFVLADLREADFGPIRERYADAEVSDLRREHYCTFGHGSLREPSGRRPPVCRSPIRESLERRSQGATLRGANLRNANLVRAGLSGADLSGADLQGASLRNADLQGADLRDADLQGAILGGADFRDASLRRAKLRGMNLSRAPLRGADLSDADLRDAVLEWADLLAATLWGADLQGAILVGADLRGADFRFANLQARPCIWQDSRAATFRKLIFGGLISPRQTSAVQYLPELISVARSFGRQISGARISERPSLEARTFVACPSGARALARLRTGICVGNSRTCAAQTSNRSTWRR